MSHSKVCFFTTFAIFLTPLAKTNNIKSHVTKYATAVCHDSLPMFSIPLLFTLPRMYIL